MSIDVNFYPGWVRKSITFTIDDGNVVLDRKFMNYVKPAGIKGTFNLLTPLRKDFSAGDYRSLYKGYEISNHCRYHAYPFSESRPVEIKDELFDQNTADPAYGYRTEEEGIYRIHTYAWTFLADDETYMKCVDSCQKELRDVFGENACRGYVWPCGEQNNPAVFKALQDYGFQSIRKTGCVRDKTGFALPGDRMRWSYNADYTCLNEVARAYDAWEDDGNLKFFCFGVHSHDFENNHRWEELETFCRDFGCRTGEFWYAAVGEIFDYEDAVRGLVITETSVSNPSNIDLYIKVNGIRKVLGAGETLPL